MCNATPSRPTGSAEPAGSVTTAAPVEGPQGSPEWILTWVTALICALILLSVEQVRNVLLHLPTRHSFGDPRHVVLWYGLIALTILVGTWAWKLVALEGYFDSFEIKHRSRALIGTASIAMGIGLLALRREESMSVNVIAMCFLIGGGLVLPTFLAEHPNMPKSVGGRLVLLLCVKAYAAYILWQLAANPDV